MTVLLLIFGWLGIVVYFCLVLFPVVLCIVFFPLKTRLNIIGPVWKGFAYVILKAAWTKPLIIDQRSPEVQKKILTQGLYIADHQSNVDIPLIITRFQLPPIMKKEVLYIPIFGLIAWASGTLVVDRKNKESRKKVFEKAANRIIEEGIGLQYYPEGTRGKGKDPKPFSEIKTALMILAFEKKIPLYPISIYGTNKVLSNMGFLNPHQKIGIIFHPAIFPEQFNDANSFALAGWEKVLSGYQELKRQLES